MRIDPLHEARRLLAQQVDPAFLADLAADPATTVEVLFDVPVRTRPPSRPGPGCPIDGTYDPGPPPRIEVADDVTAARQRFSILHEAGHHLIENDGPLNDLPAGNRRDEEVCNEVAASILLPDGLVDSMLAAGKFTAEDVAMLHEAATYASRAACCVAAVRRLHHPGCVLLSTADGTANFVAHHPSTPWRIARGTPQGDQSLLARAARGFAGRGRGVTRVRFATGGVSGDLHGDAFAADDGWIFGVFVQDTHSPWETGLNLGLTSTAAEPEQIECPRCGQAVRVWRAPCPKCGDYQCPNPNCRRCSCPVGPEPRLCPGCGLQKPPNQFSPESPLCVDCR